MIVLDTSAKTVSKYGHCAMCAFNPEWTFADRMLGYTHEASQRKHFAAHLLNMFCGRKELDYVFLHTQGNSWRDRRFRCPVSNCYFSHQSLSLRQLGNHLFIMHRSFHYGTVQSSCFSETDADFVKNLRTLFKNVDIQVLAVNA